MNKLRILQVMLILVLAMPVDAALPDGYVLKWSDEFEIAGAPDPTKWTHELGAGGWGNGELQEYTDSLDNSRVENGNLIIEVRQVGENRTPNYTSARLMTREKAQWKFGRVEIRAKLPSETGTWAGIWMMAADNLHSTISWPDNGEIDIMEHVGYEEDPLFKTLAGDDQLPNTHGTLHTRYRNGRDNQGNGASTYLADASTAFHIYAINWTEDRIEFEVDGVLYNTIYRSEYVSERNPPENPGEYWPFDQRFFLILNIAVGGSWGGHFNSGYYPTDSPYGTSGVDHDGIWPQIMEVDYVRVYGADTPPVASSVPGHVNASSMDIGDGILLRVSNNTESPHHMSHIDAGDSATFAIDVAQAGFYSVSTSVANEFAPASATFTIEETGSALTGVSLPLTGGSDTWQSLDLGNLQLQQGINTLKMTTSTGNFNLAWFKFEASQGSLWKGLQVDGFGNADTQSWMGIINVNTAPWIYSYSIDTFIFMPSTMGEIFTTDNQWIYIPKI